MATKLRDLMLLAIDLQSSSIGLTKMQLIERCKDRGFEPSQTVHQTLYIPLRYRRRLLESENHFIVSAKPSFKFIFGL